MAYATEYRSDKGIVELHHAGETDYSRTLTAVQEAGRLMNKHLTNLVLVDVTATAPAVSVPELYFLTSRLSDQRLSPSSRFAFLLGAAAANRQVAQFYRALSRNWNYKCSAFTDKQSAEAWLLGAPGPDPDVAVA
jgi:hypothetical protein